MSYGICNLGIVPLRSEPRHQSELVSQILFGEHFEILEKQEEWSKIRLSFDDYEGWTDNKQYEEIDKTYHRKLENSPIVLAGDLVDFSGSGDHDLIMVPLGATLPFYRNKRLEINKKIFTYEGEVIKKEQPKKQLVHTAFLYLNSPYLWGGKTPFGVDCSGFIQMVYKLCGFRLPRDASQQAGQGDTLGFIEEGEVGDLAFFDNEEGEIVHAGILLGNNRIIHACGRVRIDFVDHTGIYNEDVRKYSHKLRLIKRII